VAARAAVAAPVAARPVVVVPPDEVVRVVPAASGPGARSVAVVTSRISGLRRHRR
jgi:hypothetical protein